MVNSSITVVNSLGYTVMKQTQHHCTYKVMDFLNVSIQIQTPSETEDGLQLPVEKNDRNLDPQSFDKLPSKKQQKLLKDNEVSNNLL